MLCPMIRFLEELSLGAWPALKQIVHDGWILRFARGYTRRANSVQPLYPGTLPIDDKIAFCERAYRDHGQRVVFKLTDAALPRDLDQFLADRGYAKEAGTSVMTCDITPADVPPSKGIRQWHAPSPQWLEAYAHLNNLPAQHRETLAQIIGTIANPICCAALIDGEERIVSCGMALLQERWAGLFDIVTDHEHRRRGHAREIINHLILWARNHGATRAYLQVVLENIPAVNLYRAIGFTEAYQYWYRTKA